jgi:hypothetical protein
MTPFPVSPPQESGKPPYTGTPAIFFRQKTRGIVSGIACLSAFRRNRFVFRLFKYLPGTGKDVLQPGGAEDPLKKGDGVIGGGAGKVPFFQKRLEIIDGGIGRVKLNQRRLDKVDHLLKFFIQAEKRTARSGSPENFRLRQIPAFNPENFAGTGKGVVPANLIINAFKAIRPPAPPGFPFRTFARHEAAPVTVRCLQDSRLF